MLERSASQLLSERGDLGQSLTEAAGSRQFTGPATPAAQVIPVTTAPAAMQPLSPTSLAPPAAAQTQFDISLPVLDPAWQTAVNERVVWMAGRGVQSAELRLSPAELGPLQVQLAVDERGVSVTINATHAATREALEGAIPRLREMLSEQGMNLNGATVSDQGVDGRAQHEAEEGEAATSMASLADDETPAPESGSSHVARRPSPDSMVDLFA